MGSSPASTTADLLYIIEPEGGLRAYQHVNADPNTGRRQKNFEREVKTVVIENVRGKENSVSLDTAGFQFYHHPPKHSTFVNDEKIRREYYPESAELIRKLTGASRVELFDHTIRRRRLGEADDSADRRQPVSQVHVDQTTASAIARVHRHLPASEVPGLLKHRFQIINLWRPIATPAFDWPLALCDYRSVDLEQEVIPVRVIFLDREGETLGVKYNENHKWKYLHGMTPDEFVLIKCFDSIQDKNVAICTPHTGFKDPTTIEGTPPRQSIELRALVFYD